MNPANPLIVQSDGSILLEVASPRYVEARDLLARFAELEKSPEYIHTYRVTPLSLWNAASAGLRIDDILTPLTDLAKYPIPDNVQRDMREYLGRYGRVKLVKEGGNLFLVSVDVPLMLEIAGTATVRAMISPTDDVTRLRVLPGLRGHVKQALVKIGYPVEDLAGYVEGEHLDVQLRSVTAAGLPFAIRAYQQEAREVFYAGGTARGGSGCIVLPCGAGKTIVGMAAISALQTSTLILSPNTVAVRQWIDELLDKTTLTADEIGEYTGLQKQIRPVTVSTYQVMTYHTRKGQTDAASYPHFGLFNARDWGLIIYDEVHLLPAPVFRITAEL
jgi:DNA excision repair protein ERCC-3